VAGHGSVVKYAEGVRSHSPGSRVCERTLGNWSPKRIDPEGVASPATSIPDQSLIKPFQGMGLVIDHHPGCARRLATLGFERQRLRRKDDAVLKPPLRAFRQNSAGSTFPLQLRAIVMAETGFVGLHQVTGRPAASIPSSSSIPAPRRAAAALAVRPPAWQCGASPFVRRLMASRCPPSPPGA